ncbi:unnamed protein product, partial [Urochloa humidicola]
TPRRRRRPRGALLLAGARQSIRLGCRHGLALLVNRRRREAVVVWDPPSPPSSAACRTRRSSRSTVGLFVGKRRQQRARWRLPIEASLGREIGDQAAKVGMLNNVQLHA